MQAPFRTAIGENIFQNKYALNRGETWTGRARHITDAVTGPLPRRHFAPLLSKEDRDDLFHFINTGKFFPGGRYIYYAGRAAAFYNNCYLFRAEEDTREEWARLMHNSMSALMSGGGIGTDYSRLRERNAILKRTGGLASGPLPLMYAVNEGGRNVMQGGSRRVALYASLNWQHPDILEFIHAKDWDQEIAPGITYRDAKAHNFNAHAPLDMTNISPNWDDDWLGMHNRAQCSVWHENVSQAMATGEPGFSFNFGDQSEETLRNACTEVTSSDDSDVCNIGSLNMPFFDSLEEFKRGVEVASKFLVCGTLRADLPYAKVYDIREKNRRLGLGLMGVHEWLLQRGMRYEMTNELREWMHAYQVVSKNAADEHCDRFFISRPKGYRAIAPTGSISMLPGTTSGIEPLYAVAYKRRYLTEGAKWNMEYVVDGTAKVLIDQYGVDPDAIETSLDLAADPKRRIAFQADVQFYVDHGISSTINLPAWGSDLNNEDRVAGYAELISEYAPRLRGLTFYPDGARGGQPLEAVDYKSAVEREGTVFQEHDVCDITGKGGTCGA